ncbi:tyrosine-type recombinase/integrase [Pseudooceanicola nanhaiensis]|uniref:tyrosine-type recombinase/integrase n=1 Tax=Pseudooceanicola nanhaiensis TaxID=375761 RepID=UPI001CD42CE6|nr:site-specific integrase [Pseudooceanicola nanhaiensis]MCA0922200.1 site-specific integrase [Pseudooceanicola nanhaiensis]
MATFRKLKSGWRAEIFRQGVRRSKVLPTKREAQDWAARQEYELANGEQLAASTLFTDVLDRYVREVSPAKRGHRWEDLQIRRLQKDPLARKPISEITATDLAGWRDRRLRDVSAGTVRREMVLVSAIFTQARREWRMVSVNPMSDVRRPKEPPKRSRRPSDDEIERLLYVAGDDLSKSQARAVHAFLFAIETGMRAGEIVGMRSDAVDLERRVVTLPMTKNGDARQVPLSSEAVRLLRALPEGEPVFQLSSQNLDALFRKMRDKAAIEGLNFHDSRHEAITRLSRKLDVLALAKMVGHRDIKMLQRYYDATAEELARRLD